MSLTARARCLRCPWTAEGDPGTTDKAAEKHWRTEQHPTATETVMEGRQHERRS